MAISLKAARVNAGLTQAAAAQSLGISKNTLANYERYKNMPSVDRAKRISVLYNLPMDEIIFCP